MLKELHISLTFIVLVIMYVLSILALEVKNPPRVQAASGNMAVIQSYQEWRPR